MVISLWSFTPAYQSKGILPSSPNSAGGSTEHKTICHRDQFRPIRRRGADSGHPRRGRLTGGPRQAPSIGSRCAGSVTGESARMSSIGSRNALHADETTASVRRGAVDHCCLPATLHNAMSALFLRSPRTKRTAAACCNDWFGALLPPWLNQPSRSSGSPVA